ncbi:transporter [Solwaraspora sp. WMMD1047]|uniref:transporter n=1 Tax=Solwaraspora sp. WMMD1047 TaxID=3016102 RepID=UPI002417B228|nr:transporter [Solwaraspora sp. WMMD1047]MDG4827933.1 transporter [Solwaraspora sp. WMMD1047]
MSPGTDDTPPADPAAALRLIEEQQAEAARQLQPDLRLYYWPWGVAWLVGFALFFLRYGPDGRIFVDLPGWLPLTVLFTLLGAAGAVSGYAGARSYGQITGDSNRRGGWYGLAWFLGYASLVATNVQLSDHLSDELTSLLWAGSSVGLTGALHLAGAAIWLDRGLLYLGTWITVTNIVGLIAGPGWHALVIAVAGGGGMLLFGTVAWARTRKRP